VAARMLNDAQRMRLTHHVGRKTRAQLATQTDHAIVIRGAGVHAPGRGVASHSRSICSSISGDSSGMARKMRTSTSAATSCTTNPSTAFPSRPVMPIVRPDQPKEAGR
jgi:hypothetical protein